MTPDLAASGAVREGVAVLGDVFTVAGSGAGRAGSWDSEPEAVSTWYGSTLPSAALLTCAIANRGTLSLVEPASRTVDGVLREYLPLRRSTGKPWSSFAV